jgi:peptide/nickel transport system permease protein
MTVAMPVSAEPTALSAPPQELGRWGRLPTNAKVGAILLGFFVLIAVIGPLFAPYNPAYQNPSPALSMQAPSAAHWLGTTQSGQDVFSQLLTGIRLTLELAFIVGVVATALSVIVGVSAAFLGGIWDELLSLLSNVFLVIPALPLLIVLLGFLPQRGQLPTILVLSLTGWPWGARLLRAQTMAIRGRDFIGASRETGEKTWRIIVFEIIPNQTGLIAASFVNTVLFAIGASVALGFIGVADLNSWSLGTIFYWAQSQDALQLGAWWWFAPPGIVVALMGTALVLLNTGIDELSNPRLRDSSSASRIAGRRLRPTDPTPVLMAEPPRRGRMADFLHAFSRSALADGSYQLLEEKPGSRRGGRGRTGGEQR